MIMGAPTLTVEKTEADVYITGLLKGLATISEAVLFTKAPPT